MSPRHPCFLLLTSVATVALIFTIFVQSAPPSLLFTYPGLTIPPGQLPPHPGPWPVHNDLFPLCTPHLHEKKPKAHGPPSEWVELVSLTRWQIPGRQDTCQGSFPFLYWAWEEWGGGKVRNWEKGRWESSSKSWSEVSFSTEISIDSLLTSWQTFLIWLCVHFSI